MSYINSSFIKLFNKIAKYDRSLSIHENGAGNNYPDVVESIISESVTASRCAKLMASYISGKGFGAFNDVIVHKEKDITLLRFTQSISESLAEHGGVFIHVNYDGNYDIKNMSVVPFSNCRVGKIDDDGHNAKIYVCEDWGNSKIAKSATPIDVYNPNKQVIEEQVIKVGALAKYKGQMFYFRFGKYTYPLAPIHAALKDAESETQVSIYKNTSLKKGFFGKTLVVTKPLVEYDLNDSEHEEDRIRYGQQLDSRDEFRKTIREFVGAENVDGVMHMEMKFESDKLSDEIMFQNIESNIDDKLFAHTEDSVSDNICAAYKVPQVLVKPKDSGLFGASGELINQAKIFYQDQTMDERMMVEQIVSKLMAKFQTPLEDLKITPLIEKPKQDVDRQDGNSEA